MCSYCGSSAVREGSALSLHESFAAWLFPKRPPLHRLMRYYTFRSLSFSAMISSGILRSDRLVTGPSLAYTSDSTHVTLVVAHNVGYKG